MRSGIGASPVRFLPQTQADTGAFSCRYYLHEDAESKSSSMSRLFFQLAVGNLTFFSVFAAWQHHLETNGPDFTYDDFIPSFGQEFDAEEWIRLFVSFSKIPQVVLPDPQRLLIDRSTPAPSTSF